MVNEILMRGATPVAMPQPVEAPVAPTPAGTNDFSKALLAELDGPAPAAAQGVGAPTLAAPRTISLDTIPVAPPVMVAPPTPPAGPAGQTYTVQAGDSLSKIARKLGHSNWSKLYAANRGVVGANPNMIHPGQVLTLPAAWQTAATSRLAGAPSVQAAVEPAAKSPTLVAGTPPAQLPSAPIVAPPSLPVEAAVEPKPVEAAVEPQPAEPAPAATANPAVVGVATEAIDRLTAEVGGGQDHVATLREALKSIPAGHASYEAYKAKVEAYEAASGTSAPAAGPAPAMAQPPVQPQAVEPPAQPTAAAMPAGPADPAAGVGPMAPQAPADDAYGPGAPAGATIDAQLTQPAAPVVAPAPSAEDAGDASADGEEGWQAFS